MKNVDQLYDEFRKKVEVQAPELRHLKDDLPARVADTINAGGDIVCLRSFQSGGVEYSPGDLVGCKNWPPSRVAQMARQGWIIPAKEYNANAAWQSDLNHLQNVIDPARGLLNKARNALAAAEAQVTQLEMDLKHAKDLVKDKRGLLAKSEAELVTALKGPEL